MNEANWLGICRGVGCGNWKRLFPFRWLSSFRCSWVYVTGRYVALWCGLAANCPILLVKSQYVDEAR